MEQQEEIKNSIIERFNNLQPEIQQAIMDSNYEKNIYEIGKKHNLTIEQMGELEFNTTLVMLGQIHPDKYSKELLEDLKLGEDKINEIVNDINEKVIKPIRELLKKNFEDDEKLESEMMEIPPLPPYAKVEEKKVEDLEIPRPPKPAETAVKSNIVAPIINEPKNIIEEKLKGTTISEHKVSDYSVPKEINIPSFPTEGGDKEDSPKKYDPYREVI